MSLQALFGLKGKRALVTGGTSGLGLAISKAFLDAGAKVVVASHDKIACAEAEKMLGGLSKAICIELGSRSASQRLARDAAGILGGTIDILVSNAGMEGPVGPSAQANEVEMLRLFNVNLMSAFWLANAVVPGMKQAREGCLIYTASIAGLRGNGAIGPYGMTKAALAQLARNLAVEHGPRNIRANAIAPGLIETPFSDGLRDDAAFMAKRISATPLRRTGKPSEVAAAALWLASPGGAFTTGQTIVIDGSTLVSDGS